MKRVKVTGYLYIEDGEHDPGPLGPLTGDADSEIRDALSGMAMEDIEFELDEED